MIHLDSESVEQRSLPRSATDANRANAWAWAWARRFPRWAWTSTGAAIGLFDFSVLLAFDANLFVAGRDATIPLLLSFLGSYALLGWAIGGLAHARACAEEDHETIQRQLVQLERTQRALVQEEKLAGIGRLAAGVAHEVRNPLGVIRASASMAQESFDSGTDPHRALGFVCEETDRLDRLIQSLLTFAKPQPMECAETDVPKVLDRALELARLEAKDNDIALEVETAAGLPTVHADPDRLSQAVYGLTLNAMQSLTLHAEKAPEAPRRIQVRASHAEDLLCIEVADSGPGIPELLRDQVFEPFVTTKDYGTGLGLPMAMRMIEAQGGRLSLAASGPLSGACFRIEFPVMHPGTESLAAEVRG